MKRYIIALVLLGLVFFDAIGDGFRVQGFQKAHHVMEVLMIVGFLSIWKLIPFKWVYVLLYVLGRIWAFTYVFNMTAGNPISYLGESNFYDGVLIWIGEKVHQAPSHFLFIFSFMALVAWIGVILRGKRGY